MPPESAMVSIPFELKAPRSTTTGETLLGTLVVFVLKAPPAKAANAGNKRDDLDVTLTLTLLL